MKGLIVYRFGLDLPPIEIARLAGTLSPDEAERAARFRRDCDRRRFIAGRGQLRVLLGETLGRAPEAVTFGYGPHGKPHLADHDSGLRFNLSHSEDAALLVLAWHREVGVDLERVRPDIDRHGLAARFLPPMADDGPDAFFQAWTRREAYGKALGLGFPAPSHLPDPARWAVQDLDAGPDHKAALAVQILSPTEAGELYAPAGCSGIRS